MPTASHFPDINHSEVYPPALLNDAKLCCCPDQVSVLKDGLEPCRSDLVDKASQGSTSYWAKTLFGKRTDPSRDPDAIATRRSVFDDDHLAQFYWPKQEYENTHRFDPSARWTHREERALLRKIDWKITFVAVAGHFAVNLDSHNLTQANSANFLSDLHLTTNDFNLANTVYRLSYLCADLPSQLISKRIGPDRWIPIQICLWSIVSLSQSWLKGRASFLACRALLGFLQGGFVPELVLYMSYFYTNTELPIRTAIFSMSTGLCNIISSFLAYGIFHLNGVSGQTGWQWLFLIEGLVSLVIGVAAFFNMPPSPTHTETWFRPKGWLSEREEVIMVNKILRDDPTKSDMHNREPLTLKRLWTALFEYDLWSIYLIGFVTSIPIEPPSNYLTLLLRHVGFDTFNTSLLTIPSQTMGIISMLVITLVSGLVNERTFVSMTENLWVLPFLAALYALPSKPDPWLLFVGIAYWAPILSTYRSNPYRVVFQKLGVTQASIAAAVQIYQAKDAPRYKHGNRTLIIISCINVFVLYPATKAYYIWRNRQRARIWDAMTSEEKADYLNTTQDVGNKRLDFRFAH